MESPEEVAHRKEKKKRAKADERKKLRAQMEKEEKRAWLVEKKTRARDKRAEEKAEKARKRREAANPSAPPSEAAAGDIERLEEETKKANTKLVEDDVNSKTSEDAAPLTPTSKGESVPKDELTSQKADEAGLADNAVASKGESTQTESAVDVEKLAKDPELKGPEENQKPAEGSQEINENIPSPLDLSKPPPSPSVLVNGEPLSATFSTASSFRSFEFDSDIDMPPESSDSESDDDKSVAAEVEASDEIPARPEDASMFDDPWNAVCVVGLRVYSKDPKLSLEVVRPKNVEDGEAALDFDDPNKGVSA